jgi:two-component system response regulator YesN
MVGKLLMIRVLVADDEKKVSQLICQLINWHKLGMSLVGTAANGIEALEMIKQKQPDLVITDIRMPGIGGLELVEQVKALNSNIQFIIISGYSQFEYAQTAIRFGVSDYLVKPIKQDVLNATLSKIKSRFDAIRQQELDQVHILEKQEEDKIRLRKLLWQEIVSGQADTNLNFINDTFHYNFCNGNFRIFCLSADVLNIDELNEPYATDVLKLLYENTVFSIDKHLKSSCSDLQTFLVDNRISGIVNYEPKYDQKILDSLSSFIYEYCSEHHIYEHMKFHMSISDKTTDISYLKTLIEQVDLVLGQRLFNKDNTLLTDIPLCPDIEKDQLLKQYSTELKHAIDLKDLKILDSTFISLKNEIKQKEMCGMQIIKIVEEAYHLFIITHNINSDFFFTHAESMEFDFSRKLSLCSSFDMLFDLLSEISRENMATAISQTDQDRIRPINKAKLYIQDNFAKPLTLEEVSAEAGFSPSYFSTLFRKETGENFSDYLMNVRVEYAKTLLRDSQIKIKDICANIGYNDYKRFTKKFKQLTGVSPKEYRDLYS